MRLLEGSKQPTASFSEEILIYHRLKGQLQSLQTTRKDLRAKIAALQDEE